MRHIMSTSPMRQVVTALMILFIVSFVTTFILPPFFLYTTPDVFVRIGDKTLMIILTGLQAIFDNTRMIHLGALSLGLLTASMITFMITSMILCLIVMYFCVKFVLSG